MLYAAWKGSQNVINFLECFGGNCGVWGVFLVLLKLESATHGPTDIFIIGKEDEEMNLQITVCDQPVVLAK